MLYLVLFLEGIITFISPCLLPLLPIYLSFFAGGPGPGRTRALQNALGFVLGFTAVFLLLGAFAAGVGRLLMAYRTAFNLATGLIVVVFGLHYLGFFTINRARKPMRVRVLGFPSAVLFGLVFSVSWTPCVGAFLGSALMTASQQGSVGKGLGLLLAFSLGLGVPFIVSAVLIEQLKGVFDFIKRHYKVVNALSGGLLLAVGVLMMTGVFGRFLAALSV